MLLRNFTLNPLLATHISYELLCRIHMLFLKDSWIKNILDFLVYIWWITFESLGGYPVQIFYCEFEIRLFADHLYDHWRISNDIFVWYATKNILNSIVLIFQTFDMLHAAYPKFSMGWQFFFHEVMIKKINIFIVKLGKNIENYF